MSRKRKAMKFKERIKTILIGIGLIIIVAVLCLVACILFPPLISLLTALSYVVGTLAFVLFLIFLIGVAVIFFYEGATGRKY